nr:DMT family protein [uncultured Undibacterium sp.]
MQIPFIIQTTGLLILSNVFMTLSWYGRLKNLKHKAWYVTAFVSWGITLFEYLLQVPANRIGYTQYSLAQLKILQEVLTLLIFVPFLMIDMNQPFKLNYVWAGICLIGAGYFIFRS